MYIAKDLSKEEKQKQMLFAKSEKLEVQIWYNKVCQRRRMEMEQSNRKNKNPHPKIKATDNNVKALWDSVNFITGNYKRTKDVGKIVNLEGKLLNEAEKIVTEFYTYYSQIARHLFRN